MEPGGFLAGFEEATVRQSVLLNHASGRAMKVFDLTTSPRAHVHVAREMACSAVARRRGCLHLQTYDEVRVDEAGQRIGLVMPLAKHESLVEYVCSLERVDLSLLLDLAQQMKRAVDEFHAAIGAHRDVKPDNFLVHEDPATGAPHLRLCDFGYSTVLRDSQRDQRVIGTPRYMAPEIVLLAEEPAPVSYDLFACDSFALGVTIARLALATAAAEPFSPLAEGSVYIAAVLGEAPDPPADPDDDPAAPLTPSYEDEFFHCMDEHSERRLRAHVWAEIRRAQPARRRLEAALAPSSAAAPVRVPNAALLAAARPHLSLEPRLRSVAPAVARHPRDLPPWTELSPAAIESFRARPETPAGLRRLAELLGLTVTPRGGR